jgi:DNA mismatch repair protein MutL
MVIVDQQRASTVLYEQFSKYDGNQASSQQLLFPLNLFFSSSEMELIGELQLSHEHWICFDEKTIQIILLFQEFQ